MEIFVDHDRIDSEPYDQGSVEEALRLIQDDVLPTGRVVVGLRCDGQDAVTETMAATLSRPIAKVERLDVFTAGKGLLVAEAMKQAETALEDTDKECQRAAGLFNAGKAEEGIGLLGQCMSVWQQVHEAVGKSMVMLELNSEETAIEGQLLADMLGRPKEVLLQIKEALTAQDYVLLADILQYELVEVSNQWRVITARLRQEAEET